VDYVFLDVSVLHGPGKAATWLQQTLGVVADGHIGVITLTRLKSAAPSEVISTMTELRRAHFNGIVANKPTQRKYLKGWLARADRVEADALKMVRSAISAIAALA
jgi:lysozyme family protein